jgi:elongation factor Ts
MQAQLVKKLRDLTGSPIIYCKKALEECQGDFPKAQEWLRIKGVSQAHKKMNNSTGAGLVSGLLTEKSGYLLEVLCETDFVARTDIFQTFTREVMRSWSSSSEDFSSWPSLHLSLYNQSGESAKLETISKTQENVNVRRGVKYEVSPTSVVGLYLHNQLDPMLGLSGSIVKVRSAEPLHQNIEKVRNLAQQISMQIIAGKPLFLRKKDVPEEFWNKERMAVEEKLDESLKNKEKKVLESIIKGKVEKSIDQVCLYEQVFMISEDSEEKQVKDVVLAVAKEISNQLEIEAYSIFACEALSS